VIRVVPLEAFEEPDLRFACDALFKAFGVGTVVTEPAELPRIEELDGGLPAAELVKAALAPRGIADDVTLFLTRRRLSQAKGPHGAPPTHGFAAYDGDRAIVTTALFGKLAELSEEFQKRLAKQAVHEVGHLFGLHACLEAKCSMGPPWTELYAQHVEPTLCNFCREKSEKRLQLARA